MSAAPAQPGLFPETPEERVKRWDAEICALIAKRGGGPYNQAMSDAEYAVLTQIRYHRGLHYAVNIGAIAQRTGLNDRAIKQAVRGLRLTFRLPIASSKHGGRGGYYLWITDEDLAAWKGELLRQINGEIEIFRAVTSEADVLDIVKQLWAGVTP